MAKRFRCKVGIHSWCWQTGIFTLRFCNHCGIEDPPGETARIIALLKGPDV